MNSSTPLPSFLNLPFNFDQTPDPSEDFHVALESLAHPANSFKIDDAGHFVKIGLIGELWELFKGLLGFENHAKTEYFRYRLLQYITQGAEAGLITKEDCSGPNNLINRVARIAGLVLGRSQPQHLKEIESIFRAVIQHATQPEQIKPDFKGLVHSYRLNHIHQLVPQSILGKIKNAWNQQQEDHFSQDEFDSSEETDKEASEFSEFDSANQAKLVSEVAQKNPSSFELLNKLAETEAFAKELEKFTPSKEISFKELYLRSILPSPLKGTNEKLVYDWFSGQLSSGYGEQKRAFFDRALNLLNFKEAFALLVASYRLPILLKNEEQKQLDPSEHFIEQCQLQAAAMGTRLEKLIQEHPSEYQALDLTSLSPYATAMQFDTSAVSYQFFFELIEQQRLLQEREKADTWIKVGILGSFLGAGVLLKGAAFVLRKWKEANALPPPPTLMDHVKNYVPIVATVALGILGAYVLRPSKKAKEKDELREGANPEEQRRIDETSGSLGRTGTSETRSTSSSGVVDDSAALENSSQRFDPKEIDDLLQKKNIITEYYYDSGKFYARPAELSYYYLSNIAEVKQQILNGLEIYVLPNENFELIIPKASLDEQAQLTKIVVTVFSHKEDTCLLINIPSREGHYVEIYTLRLYLENVEDIKHALNHMQITDDQIIIPLKEADRQREERLQKEEQQRIELERVQQEEDRYYNEEEERLEEWLIRDQRKKEVARKNRTERLARIETGKLRSAIRRKERTECKMKNRQISNQQTLLKKSTDLLKNYEILSPKLSASAGENLKLKIQKAIKDLRTINGRLNTPPVSEEILKQTAKKLQSLSRTYTYILKTVKIEATHKEHIQKSSEESENPQRVEQIETPSKKLHSKIQNLRSARRKKTRPRIDVQPKACLPNPSACDEKLFQTAKDILEIPSSLLQEKAFGLKMITNKMHEGCSGIRTLVSQLRIHSTSTVRPYGLITCQNDKALVVFDQDKKNLTLFYYDAMGEIKFKTFNHRRFVNFLNSSEFKHFGINPETKQRDPNVLVNMYLLNEENLKDIQKIQSHIDRQAATPTPPTTETVTPVAQPIGRVVNKPKITSRMIRKRVAEASKKRQSNEAKTASTENNSFKI